MRPSRWADTACMTLLAGAAYLLLLQKAIHHVDANAMVRALALPDYILGYAHFGYRAITELVYALSGPEQPIHGTLQALSAIGAALAVGASHRAALAGGLGRAQAILAAGGAGTVLSWVHFATVLEIHAVFLLPASCTWWALARFCQVPGFGRITLVGVASALATAIHYSGILLPLLGLLGLWVADVPRRFGVRRTLLAWGLWCVVHIALFWGLHDLVFAFSGMVSDQATAGFLRDRFATFDGSPGGIATVVYYEVLRPFAPWSVAFLLAWIRPALRRAVVALLIGWLGFVAVDIVTLCGAFEVGAYALPMALPTVALCAVAWRHSWMLLAVATSLLCSIGSHFQQDPLRIPAPGFGQGLHAWHQRNPGALFLLGGYPELDSVLVYAPPTPHHAIFEAEFVRWLQPATSDATVRAELTERADKAAAAGGCLVFSALARSMFELLPRNRTLFEELGRSFLLEPVEQGEFRGIAIRPRPR